MKKYFSAIELSNTFPEWTRIRTDDQSIGFRLFNSLSRPLDKMERSLFIAGKNTHLVTANLDEVDITYRINLPTTFSFQQDNTDPGFTSYLVPTVIGNPDTDMYTVSSVPSNTLEEFWYQALPNRYSINTTVTGVNHILTTITSDDSPFEVTLNHHLGGGKVYIEASGGTEYISVEDNIVYRGRVIIQGLTRKGTEEQDVIVFPWDMKQQSNKEFETITNIKILDVEPGVTFNFYSADFANGPYIDQFNLAFSTGRRKIDQFWNLGTVASGQSLDLIQYTSDAWEDLLIGLTDQEIVQSWELLDNNNTAISGIDIALQPFTERAWLVTEDAKLYCFDLADSLVSGVELLKEKSFGSHVQFDYNSRYLTRGETFSFTPTHRRAIKEISKYRIWFQKPDGTKYGLLDGDSVAYSSNFWVIDQQLQSPVTDRIHLILDQLGEYLFVIETIFIDGEEQNERIIVQTCFKKPIAELDLSTSIPYTISGIDFDTDQRMWVIANDTYYQINLHSDVMLIYYDNKVIYFKENYDNVDVTP